MRSPQAVPKEADGAMEVEKKEEEEEEKVKESLVFLDGLGCNFQHGLRQPDLTRDASVMAHATP